MTLKFHTLGTEEFVVFYGATWSLVILIGPRLRSPSYSHSFFSKMNEAGFNETKGARFLIRRKALEKVRFRKDISFGRRLNFLLE
jgi:hypothetical protein